MYYIAWPRRGLLFAFPLLVGFFLLALTGQAAAHSPHDEVMRLASDPATPRHLYAVVRYMLLASFDLGAQWSRISAGIWRHRLHDVATVPKSHPHGANVDLVIASEDGVLHRKDGSWILAEIGSVRRVYLTSDAIVALTEDGQLLRSEDLIDWSSLDDGVSTAVVSGDDLWIGTVSGDVRSGGTTHKTLDSPVTAVLPHDGNLLVGTSSGLYVVDGERVEQRDARGVTSIAASGEVVMASLHSDGVLLSRNGGRTFGDLSDGLTTDPQADDAGYGVPHFNQVLAVSDGADDHWFCAGFDGLFTTQGLASWIELPGIQPRTLIAGLATDGADLLYSTYGAGIVRRCEGAGEVQENRGLRAKRLFAATPVEGRTIIANHA